MALDASGVGGGASSPAACPGPAPPTAAPAGHGRGRCPARRRRCGGPSIGLQRLAWPPGTVEGQDQLPVQPLVQRMLHHQRLDLGDQFGVPAQGQVGVHRAASTVNSRSWSRGISVRANGSSVNSASGASRHRASATRSSAAARPAPPATRRRPAGRGARNGADPPPRIQLEQITRPPSHDVNRRVCRLGCEQRLPQP